MNPSQRIWTLPHKNTWIEASLVEQNGDTCILRKPTGSTIEVKIADLSDADKQHLIKTPKTQKDPIPPTIQSIQPLKESVRVVITDIDIPFSRIFAIALQWAIAIIPAIILASMILSTMLLLTMVSCVM